MGVIGAFWPLAATLSFVRAVGFLLFLVWATIAGIAVVRSAESDAGNPAGRAPGAART